MRAALLLACAAGAASAQELRLVLPAGASRGQELDVRCFGKGLDDTVSAVWFRGGIDVTELEVESDGKVRLHLRVAHDCELGTFQLLLHTRRGLTRAACFSIGPLPSVPEAAEHASADRAQHVDLDTTVDGRVLGEETDWYAFDAAAGQVVCVEAEAVRLGFYDLDLQLELFGPDGTLLQRCDDSALGQADPIAFLRAAAAGTYRLAVRDVAYRGSTLGVYRLHVGTFPRPLGLLPAGGRPGQVVDTALLGDPTPATVGVALPAQPGLHEVFPAANGRIAPTPVRVAVDDRPGCIEGAEPAEAPAAPYAFHGVVAAAGEEDRFAFRAAKGERIDIRVLARSLRSALDPVLSVRDADGKQLATNDDALGLDARLRFAPPADGTYVVAVTDHLHRGGPAFCYRVEVGELDAGATTREAVPGRRAEDLGVAVPRGGRNATLIRVDGLDPRQGITLGFDALPRGVRAQPARLLEAAVVPVVFTATADADGHALATPTAAAEQGDLQRAIRHEHAYPVLRVDNDQPYAYRAARALPVVVTDPMPFTIEVEAPRVPLVQRGALPLPVRITRAEGFDGAVTIRALSLPPGMSAGVVRLTGKECDGTLALDANARAALGEWPIVLTATAVVGGVARTTTTDALRVAVEEPWITAKLPRAAVEQGAEATFEVELAAAREFDGTVTAELGRVPRGVAVAVPAIEAHTAKLPIRLTAAADAPVGRHTGIYVRLTIATPAGVITHTDDGGELRVDAPLPARSGGAGGAR